MRKILIFTVMALFSIVGLKTANAEEINVNQTFTSDSVFNPFSPPPEDVIYTFSISGTVSLHSSTSLVRVLLNTDKGEFMVLESYPLISADTLFEGKELCNLPLQSEQNQQVIDLSTYPNGIYLFSLFINEKLIESVKLSKGLK